MFQVVSGDPDAIIEKIQFVPAIDQQNQGQCRATAVDAKKQQRGSEDTCRDAGGEP